MLRLVLRGAKILLTEGPVSVVKKTKNYFKQREIVNTNGGFNKNFKDVLFINGCALEHPQRYRVWHQIEQLHFNNFSCDAVFYDKLKLEDLNYYRAFIFYRCPYTKTIGEFIKLANKNNKVTFFDVDDLVIDEKYTKDVKYLKECTQEEKRLYLEGVSLMQKTLRLCDYAITTTTGLKLELENYCKGEVFINRNVASDFMASKSEEALTCINEKKYTILQQEYFKDEIQNKTSFIMGYFSGSITHNEDFELIKDDVIYILEKYSNAKLLLMGLLDLPKEFEKYESQVIIVPFLSYDKLPEIIAMVDVNLVPLVDTIFNAAKSENKWVEAALVKTVTISSAVGPFLELIKNGENGFLATSSEEWRNALENCINNNSQMKKAAINAFNEVSENCLTSLTGGGLAKFINSKLAKSVLFVLPSTKVSGGVNVILKHAEVLKKNGADVLVYSMNPDLNKEKIIENTSIPIISCYYTNLHATFDIGVATLWTTCNVVINYPKIIQKMYVVQGFEVDFSKFLSYNRMNASITYTYPYVFKYVTVSKWCENWLSKKYNINANYIKNGLNLSFFKHKTRTFKPDEKIKVLVEGSSEDYFKNVDESFTVTNKLDKNLYEIWYLSYSGEPKKWYEADKVFNSVPYEEVGKIYQSCDIILKTSILESFSYPPLEMMATGGFAIVRKNGGNTEYLTHNENCLMYDEFDLDLVLSYFEQIRTNKDLRNRLIENSKKTVDERNWVNIEEDIKNLYFN